jgi:hypothetical protein
MKNKRKNIIKRKFNPNKNEEEQMNLAFRIFFVITAIIYLIGIVLFATGGYDKWIGKP